MNAGGSKSTGGSSGSGAAGSSGFSGTGAIAGTSATGGAGGSGPISCDGVLGDACATEQYAAEAQPVDIFIMLDQSQSMAVNASINDSIDEWASVTAALKYFITLPQSAGLRVGIQYFGQPPTGLMGTYSATNPLGDDQGSSCNPADYATPDVPIAELPGNAAALTTSIDNHRPSTLTPTRPALEGALTYAQNWATTNSRMTVVVFATDGFPTVCNTDLNAMRNLAAQAAAATPRVLTFVIGIGGDQNLASLAASGGTGDPFIIDTSNPTTAQDQFAQAMRTIAATPLSCDFAIPTDPNGGPVASSTLNLTFTPNLSACSVIRRVTTQAECSTVDQGWYFDNNTTPKRVLLCDDTCNNLGAGVMEMRVGCPTVTGPR
jgi:hypothetical protein